MQSAKRKKHSPPPAAIELKSNLFYTSAECCRLLRCSQPTLVRLRRDRGFPLKMVAKGVAYGADIERWFAEQADRPVVSRPRKNKSAS